jgi:hypothetical protein
VNDIIPGQLQHVGVLGVAEGTTLVVLGASGAPNGPDPPVLEVVGHCIDG